MAPKGSGQPDQQLPIVTGPAAKLLFWLLILATARCMSANDLYMNILSSNKFCEQFAFPAASFEDQLMNTAVKRVFSGKESGHTDH